MIKYAVRSRQLIDVVGDIRRKKIIISPYFQRNLVWRLIHKQDFIKTILLGFPFPQIFLAKGGIDVDEMTSISLVVDGQQRMNSILGFIENEFDVDGKFFNSLTKDEKDNFLVYELAIIELQMESNDPQIKEVFQRLNRTFYSLTNIEKIAMEYAPSELMLVAKMLAREIEFKNTKEEHLIDPNVPQTFVNWAQKKKFVNFNELVLETPIFTKYEISRKVHLQIILNILGTIERGFFNRNIPSSMIEEYSENFQTKDQIVDKLEKIAKCYVEMNFPANSLWNNKANFFTLIIFLYNYYESTIGKLKTAQIKKKLTTFEKNLNSEYQLASKEAVNNRKERLLRNKYLTVLFEV